MTAKPPVEPDPLPPAALLRKTKEPGSDEEYHRKRLQRAHRFYRRFPSPPALSGKVVLDFGTGFGALAIYAAQQGARLVHAIDLDEESLDNARAQLSERYPELVDRIEFELADVTRIRGRGYDVIVSMAVLEHVADPAEVLRAFRTLLNPGGKAYLGVGPLYRAPWGDHKRLAAPLHRIFPWAHLVFPESWLLKRYRRRNPPFRPQSLIDLGLNGLKLSDYQRAIADSGLVVDFFHVNRVEKKWLMAILVGLRRIPALHDLLSSNFYCVLRRPDPADG